jgi:glutaredoxin-related protein
MSPKIEIQAYLKPHCGWSMGVRAIMEKYDLEYTDLDIINNPDIYAEMVEKSGQNLSPCVEVNGVMLTDVSGEEVEEYFLKNDLVETVEHEATAPTDSPCTDEEHAAMKAAAESKTIRFF